MAGADCFAAVLDQCTALLRRAHQHEVDDLQAQIVELKRDNCDLRARVDELKSDPSPPSHLPSPVLGRNSCAQVTPTLTTDDSGGECAAAYAIHGMQSSSERSDWSRSAHRILHGAASQQRLKIAKHNAPKHSSNPVIAFVETLIRSNGFELFFCAVIALNTLVIAIEAQHAGRCAAADFGYAIPSSSVAARWRSADDVFAFFDWSFGILFTVEIVLRIVGLRRKFMCSIWNWVDLAVTFIWFVSIWGSKLPINPLVIRMGRFGRLARLVRLVRKIQGFDSLFLMMTALTGSVSILGWTCCMLGLILVLFALLLNGFLMEYYFQNEAFPHSERSEIFRYFGSFTTSVFSMFELTLANWPPVARALSEYVSEWFILITLLHKLTVGFAIVGVINGVFIQETFKVAQQDDEIMMRQARKASTTHERKMRQLVKTADASVDGMLDIDEFRTIFEDPALRSWIASMELVPRDVDTLFAMMDNGDGILSVEEVIKGVAKFKGTARNFDLHILLHEHRRLLHEFRHLQASLEKHLNPHHANSAALTQELDVVHLRTSQPGCAKTSAQRAGTATRNGNASWSPGRRSGAGASVPKE